MPEEKLTKEQEEAFENVLILLRGMLQDRSVPRNIKRLAQKGITIINEGNDSPGILASNVMYLVGDLSQDPNIPFASRTTVYRIISILETIKD